MKNSPDTELVPASQVWSGSGLWKKTVPIAKFDAHIASSKDLFGNWKWTDSPQSIDIFRDTVVIHFHQEDRSDHKSPDSLTVLHTYDYDVQVDLGKKSRKLFFFTLVSNRQKKSELPISFGFSDLEELKSCSGLLLICVKQIEMGLLEPMFTLGRGKFGKVVAARIRRGGRWYYRAVKEVDCREQRTPKHLQRERLVIELLSHNPSPFVVETMLAAKRGAHLYYVMVLARAGDLYTLLREHSITFAAARFYAGEILLALEHLHSLHVLYRDLKPENILVDDTGHLQLADFGLATYVGPNGQARTCCGTESYTPPEMLHRRGYQTSVDFWQFGCFLYELFVGHSPFYQRGQTLPELKQRILAAEYPLPEAHSSRWRLLLAELLVADPGRRLGSGAAAAPADRGWAAVRGRPFFAVDWEALRARRAAPPIDVSGGVAADRMAGNFDEEFTKEDPAYAYDDAQRTAFEGALAGFDFQPHAHVRRLAADVWRGAEAAAAAGGGLVGGGGRARPLSPREAAGRLSTVHAAVGAGEGAAAAAAAARPGRSEDASEHSEAGAAAVAPALAALSLSGGGRGAKGVPTGGGGGGGGEAPVASVRVGGPEEDGDSSGREASGGGIFF